MTEFEKSLNNHLDELLSFARKRLNDPQLAADAVQDSMLKALKARDKLRKNESTRAWLYRILRNTIIDLYRWNSVAVSIPDPDAILVENDIDTMACNCIEKLLPTMNKDYAFIISELELKQKSTPETALKMKITPDNLKVKRHRARRQLKERLEQTCRLCARHGCLDCDCS